MIDFDKMTKEEHEQYREMEGIKEGLDDSIEKINYKLNFIKVILDNTDDEKMERSIYEGYEQALIDVRSMLYKVKYESGDSEC